MPKAGGCVGENRKRQPAYEKLQFYQNICELRKLIFTITMKFGRENYKLVSQMRDAARSAKQNIREGYRKRSAGEFAHSIRISQGSLEELSGDIDDSFEDKLINEEEHRTVQELINSAIYLSGRYLISLAKMKDEDKWKKPFVV